jgi:hypothetical protein
MQGAAVGPDEVRGVVPHVERYGWLGRPGALVRRLVFFLGNHPHRFTKLGVSELARSKNEIYQSGGCQRIGSFLSKS